MPCPVLSWALSCSPPYPELIQLLRSYLSPIPPLHDQARVQGHAPGSGAGIHAGFDPVLEWKEWSLIFKGEKSRKKERNPERTTPWVGNVGMGL